MIYFDSAATSYPKPPSVISETSRCMSEYCGNPGRGSHPLAVAAAGKLYECREEAADMFGAPSAESVVFTMNTTYAINTALEAFIPDGAHILISDLEHNAVLRPVISLAESGRITYDVFPTRGSVSQVICGIDSRLRSNTRAVVCTMASNICSNRIPVCEIGRFCRSKELLFIADGAQAAGHRNISMADMCIDVLCLPGHKGLYGPQGTGMMIVGTDVVGESFIKGGSGSDSLSPHMPEILPDRYEAGTGNTPGIAGLLEGMRFVRNTGISKIESIEKELWYRLYSRIGGDRRFIVYGDVYPSSVLLLNKKGRSPSELGRYLSERGICTRSGLHCAPLAHKTIGTGENGGVRISFSVFNTLKEVDILCDALYRA